jgi:hypothetical protein
MMVLRVSWCWSERLRSGASIRDTRIDVVRCWEVSAVRICTLEKCVVKLAVRRKSLLPGVKKVGRILLSLLMTSSRTTLQVLAETWTTDIPASKPLRRFMP